MGGSVDEDGKSLGEKVEGQVALKKLAAFKKMCEVLDEERALGYFFPQSLTKIYESMTSRKVSKVSKVRCFDIRKCTSATFAQAILYAWVQLHLLSKAMRVFTQVCAFISNHPRLPQSKRMKCHLMCSAW